MPDESIGRTPQASGLKTYQGYERVALAVTASMFVLAMISRSYHWDWIFDSAYLLAGIALVTGQRGKVSSTYAQTPSKWPLFLCVYLSVDSVLGAATLLRSPGTLLLVYAVLSGLYAAALALRLREVGIPLDSIPWSSLSRPSALFLMVGALLPLFCMYLPMLPYFYGFQGWSGPMVMYLPGTVHMSAGHTVRIGSTVVLPGYTFLFGHLACLLLAGTAMLVVLRQNSLITAARAVMLSRTAVVAVLLWWLFIAKGYRALDHVVNDAFVAGCVFLLARLFAFPERTEANC